MLTTLIGLGFGMLQGVRHAIEPDHLAAVSTLVADRRSARSAASYAAAWGLGHALALLAVGGALFSLRARLPGRMAAAFELAVAVMLVALGVRALERGLRATLSGDRRPVAPTAGASAARALPRRPLVVGCVHGLAGSGALAAVVGAQMPSLPAGLAYMLVYGGGAALGMAILAGAAGVPLGLLVRTRHGLPALLAATGALSLLLGVAWGWSAVTGASR
ncbi:MAG TPA: hypothetical protein VE987_17450 [Polyangiaceae bacterium]|nr:hypothetical protein [Polyangiaceae bacterium]